MDGAKGEEGINEVMIQLEGRPKEEAAWEDEGEIVLLCKSYNPITLHCIDNLSLKSLMLKDLTIDTGLS